ncbi:unnamed protein product [Candidula unifasciata]|uniref:Uncharacterized protein n=1 Tax=Candidula unifasciata TaxID=100452 RepID=A0A8S3YL52_9EUPU|nr:unnamed protein product [Candidula unifasciata]
MNIPTQNMKLVWPHHHRQQQSPSGFQTVQDRTPHGLGRGRGRGRGYLRELNGKLAQKSPFTGPASEDRTVQRQKDLIVVKFDNTAGDKNTEVKYEEEFPGLISDKQNQSQTSVPRRGPTGRTSARGSGDQLRGNGQNVQRTKEPQRKVLPQAPQQSSPKVEPVEAQPVIPNNLDASPEPVESHTNPESGEDSDEWEDCSDASDIPEEDDSFQADVAKVSETKESTAVHDLHLECTLAPDVSEFVPESPDFMKTPPGHVKVLNWATDCCPTSPSSQDSSVTSPLSASQG